MEMLTNVGHDSDGGTKNNSDDNKHVVDIQMFPDCSNNFM